MTATTKPAEITAAQYKTVCEALAPDATVTALCKVLGIARSAHYNRLQNGVRGAEAIRLRDSCAAAVTNLRARARTLDRFTTSG